MYRFATIKVPVPFTSVVLAAALTILALPVHADGLTRVEQKIFGMDCAPCAYGIETGLKRLPGVTDVRVSLNEGMATVALKPDSTVTIESIRKIIRDNGFTPKAANVVVTGNLVRADGRTWLEVSGLPRYQLTGATTDVEAMLERRPNGKLELQGEIPESDSIARKLIVTSPTS